MKLIIKTKDPDFISYLCEVYIKSLYDDKVNLQRFENINNKLNIDGNEIIQSAIEDLEISDNNGSVYIININDSLKDLVQTITYGNMRIKGYPILLEIFNYITNNIDNIYRRWKYGY